MIVLLVSSLALAAPRTVTLEQALELARSRAPQNQLAQADTALARAQAHEAASWFGPTVTAKANALWWDGPLEAELFDGDPCANLGEEYAAFQGMCTELIGPFAEPMLLREARTQQTSVQATLPLTGMLQVWAGHRARRAQLVAAQAQAEQTRAQVSLDVVSTWLSAQEAAEMVQVAQTAQAALQAHLERAQAFHEAGVIGHDEVLQIQVALGRAQTGLRQAQLGVALSQRKLAVITGAEDDALAPPPAALDALPPLPTDPDTLPPQVRVVQAQAQAARDARDAARADLLPQVGAVTSWTRSWGLGTLAAQQERYAGLGLEWDVWGWGRKQAAIQAARARLDKAEAGLDAARRAADLQTEAALGQARVAHQAWEASAVQVQQTEEHLEITTAWFETHARTAADLLQAQALHTQAQAEHLTSAFDYLSAIAQAQAAMGVPVNPLDP